MHVPHGPQLKVMKKILRKIHGPVFNTETQQWELRSNAQLENLYKRENIIQYVKNIRMQWAGHAWRAEGMKDA